MKRLFKQIAGERLKLVCALCCVAGFLAGGCSDAPTVSNPLNSNAPSAAATPTPVAAKPSAPPRSPGGDAIDTSKFDAEIKQAEAALKPKPKDEEARRTLARAYLARADALTQARQYRSALGDYRRAMKYDPENEDANEMATTIINILKSMGRDVPAEGTEPPPMPFTGSEQTGNSSQKKSY